MANPILEPPKRALIENDEPSILDRDISQITAKDFLHILDREGLGASALSLMPEKKKLELYSEPEWTKAIHVRDLVRVLKTEKKKVELELPIDLGWRVNPPWATTVDPAALASQVARGNGSSYPTPDDPGHSFPWPIEIRKASLDRRFEMVATQLAHLQTAVQELKAKLEAAPLR